MAQIKVESNGPVVKVPPSFADVGILRVVGQSFGKSKNSGLEQITLKCEIVAPESVVIDEQEYILAGQEITLYLGISDKKNDKAKESPMSRTKEFHEKLGLPLEIDTENLQYEGLQFEWHLQSAEQILMRGKEPILDKNGKPRSIGWNWNNFIGNALGPVAAE